MAIQFHLESRELKIENIRNIKSWIKKIIREEGYIEGKINLILSNDERLLKLNQMYLSKDEYTDILTFDYGGEKKISGDLFISAERIKENAVKYKKTVKEEFMRVCIHGMLHLMGYKDDNEENKMMMRKKEDECLKKV